MVTTVVRNVGQSVEMFKRSLYFYSFWCTPVSPKYNNLQLMHVLSLQTDEVEINLRVREMCINIILYVNVWEIQIGNIHSKS